MPRNPTLPLTADEQTWVEKFQPVLVAAHVKAAPVTVHYFKRDGSKGAATGPIQYFSGSESNYSVTVDTTATKGRPTTVNVRLIRRVLV